MRARTGTNAERRVREVKEKAEEVREIVKEVNAKVKNDVERGAKGARTKTRKERGRKRSQKGWLVMEVVYFWRFLGCCVILERALRLDNSYRSPLLAASLNGGGGGECHPIFS